MKNTAPEKSTWINIFISEYYYPNSSIALLQQAGRSLGKSSLTLNEPEN
jgi:hypothetical protein